MATVTVSQTVTSAAYTRVSNGENNVTLVIGTNEVIRIIVGVAPLANASNYIPMKGPGTSSVRGAVFSIEGLQTDDVWVRAESSDVTLNIIRGTAAVRLADATAQ